MNATDRQKIVTFVGPDGARLAVPAGAVEKLEEFSPAQVLRSGPRWEAHYQGGALPLIRLEQVVEERRLSPRHPDAVLGSERKSYPALIFPAGPTGGQSFGLVVYEILKTAEIDLAKKNRGSRGGVAYTVELDDHVVEMLDVAHILRVHEEHLKGKEKAELTR